VFVITVSSFNKVERLNRIKKSFTILRISIINQEREKLIKICEFECDSLTRDSITYYLLLLDTRFFQCSPRLAIAVVA